MCKTKECYSCKEVKNVDQFTKRAASEDGLYPSCKVCKRKRAKELKKTKTGMVGVIYSRQKINAKKRGHEAPEYSLKYLQDFMLGNAEFHTYYADWVNSGYDKWRAPSINRIHSDIGYTKDNIEVVDWEDNCAQSYAEKLSDAANGVYDRTTVAQINAKTGAFIDTHISMSSAARKLGIDMNGISKCCLGKQKTCAGFKWVAVAYNQ